MKLASVEVNLMVSLDIQEVGNASGCVYSAELRRWDSSLYWPIYLQCSDLVPLPQFICSKFIAQAAIFLSFSLLLFKVILRVLP
jgi:hypothetical protein